MELTNIFNCYEPLVLTEIDRVANAHGLELDIDVYEEIARLALSALPACYLYRSRSPMRVLSESDLDEMTRDVQAAVKQAYVVVSRKAA